MSETHINVFYAEVERTQNELDIAQGNFDRAEAVLAEKLKELEPEAPTVVKEKKPKAAKKAKAAKK